MLAMLAEGRGEDRGGVGGGRPSGWAPGREGVCGWAWARTRCVGLPGLGRKERGNSGAANRRPLWREARGAAKSATLRSGGGGARARVAADPSIRKDSAQVDRGTFSIPAPRLGSPWCAPPFCTDRSRCCLQAESKPGWPEHRFAIAAADPAGHHRLRHPRIAWGTP